MYCKKKCACVVNERKIVMFCFCDKMKRSNMRNHLARFHFYQGKGRKIIKKFPKLAQSRYSREGSSGC